MVAAQRVKTGVVVSYPIASPSEWPRPPTKFVRWQTTPVRPLRLIQAAERITRLLMLSGYLASSQSAKRSRPAPDTTIEPLRRPAHEFRFEGTRVTHSLLCAEEGTDLFGRPAKPLNGLLGRAGLEPATTDYGSRHSSSATRRNDYTPARRSRPVC
jgi:hypothetical protein